jgi:phosphoribosylformylglycinamidine synthase
VVVGAPLVVLGGPSMLIGLGGGAASSVGSGQSSSDLDFASVQRGNAEMQRRAQEVIDRCWAMGDENPILLIHDVGAGGLSNALPEAIAHSRRGGRIDLRRSRAPNPELSPMEIWCNEAQERYVLALIPGSEAQLRRCASASAARTPWWARSPRTDASPCATRCCSTTPVDMPIEVLLGKTPRMVRDVRSTLKRGRDTSAEGSIGDSLDRLLGCRPSPTSLSDHDRRSHRGRTDQPRPDGRAVAGAGGGCCGLLERYEGYGGEAMAMGERSAGGAVECAGIGTSGRRRGDHQHRRGGHSRASPTSVCRPTGWPPAASRARMPTCTPPCARSE